MSIDELFEQLDETLDGGLRIPGKKSVLDVEAIRAIVDDMRMTLPQEIAQAKNIVKDRSEIVAGAKREADGIIRAAEERAKALVAEEEITKLAQAKAGEIITAAQLKSKEMRRAAQDFVDDIMRRADDGLTANLAEVRKTRAALKQQAPAAPKQEIKE